MNPCLEKHKLELYKKEMFHYKKKRKNLIKKKNIYLDTKAQANLVC